MRQSFRQSFRNLRRAGSGRRSRTVHSSIRGRSSMRGGTGASIRSAPQLHPGVRQTPQTSCQTVIKCLTFTTTFISGMHFNMCLLSLVIIGSLMNVPYFLNLSMV